MRELPRRASLSSSAFGVGRLASEVPLCRQARDALTSSGGAEGLALSGGGIASAAGTGSRRSIEVRPRHASERCAPQPVRPPVPPPPHAPPKRYARPPRASCSSPACRSTFSCPSMQRRYRCHRRRLNFCQTFGLPCSHSTLGRHQGAREPAGAPPLVERDTRTVRMTAAGWRSRGACSCAAGAQDVVAGAPGTRGSRCRGCAASGVDSHHRAVPALGR